MMSFEDLFELHGKKLIYFEMKWRSKRYENFSSVI